MTDNEIIKALKKWCDNNCEKVCPHPKMCDKCVVTYIKSALDLIKRQKAEIERYKQEQNEINAMLDRLGVILFGSREEWEKKLIAHIDKQRKEDENANR